MATARKSAKRAASKKSRTRRASARKKTTRKKTVSRRSSVKAKPRRRSRRKKAAAVLRQRAAKGLRAARSGVKTVKQTGGKIWESLRTTTTQVVGGVRDRLNDDAGPTTPNR
jgi:hypothetical protein